jgi:hypothetical protein
MSLNTKAFKAANFRSSKAATWGIGIQRLLIIDPS